MAKLSMKSHVSEEVLAFLEDDLEESEGGMQDSFFPDSDEKLGCEVSSDEDSGKERWE